MNPLISESLKRGNVRYLFVFPQVLMNRLEKKWVKWVGEYMTKYGQPPTLDRLCDEFMDFVAETSADPLQDLYDRTLKAKKNFHTRAFIEQHLDELREGADPTDLILELSSVLNDGSVASIDTGTFDKSEYYRVVNMISMNLPTVDAATGGVALGDLIYIVGRPGDGKTTLLLHLIARWFWEGKRILCISNEIPYIDMLFKIDCILAGIPVGEKRSGKFSETSKRKLHFLQYIQSVAPNLIIMPDHPVRKPAELQALIEQHKPDVVAIDGAYLMSIDGTATAEWEDLAAVSRELKQIANNKNVPIVGVLQANRTAADKTTVAGDAIAGTDAFFQDADIIMAVRGVVNTTTGRGREVQVTSTKNRHGPMFSCLLLYNFEDMTMRELE